MHHAPYKPPSLGAVNDFRRVGMAKVWESRLQAFLARSVLGNLAIEMDSRKYNGATLVGLNGIVIKSHGSADSLAFQHAIDTAVVEVSNQLPQQIGNMLQEEAA